MYSLEAFAGLRRVMARGALCRMSVHVNCVMERSCMFSLGDFCRVAIASIVLSTATGAHADLLIGDSIGFEVASPVLRFADGAGGSALPFDSFGTDLVNGTDVLREASAITYEPQENVLYAADFVGKAIRVYAATASGNAPALRVLNPPALGQPRRVAIDSAHDELITVYGGCCLAVYSRMASGSATPLRTVQYGGGAGSVTRLNYPTGVALRTASDEMLVPDAGMAPGNAPFGVILFFARSASGNAAPSRTIEGPDTKLGTAAYYIAYDSGHDEIIVVSEDASGTTPVLRINIFAGSASGNSAPLRSISGTATLLEDIHAISYDPYTESLYVSQGGENGAVARVLAFTRSANGNVAPTRVLNAGPNSFTAPRGVAVIPGEVVFADGFQ